MFRNELKAKLDRVQISYAKLAYETNNADIYAAAMRAAKSVQLTADRVINPQTSEQKRRPSDYVSKRLVDIAIRFNTKIPALITVDELRSAVTDLRAVLDRSA